MSIENMKKLLSVLNESSQNIAEAKTVGDITLDNGKITYQGKAVGEVMSDFKHGYHPAIRLTVNGKTTWFEQDTPNLIDTIFGAIAKAVGAENLVDEDNEANSQHRQWWVTLRNGKIISGPWQTPEEADRNIRSIRQMVDCGFNDDGYISTSPGDEVGGPSGTSPFKGKTNESYSNNDDVMDTVMARRKEREGKPAEKNPLSHGKDGNYVGDKNLQGQVIPQDEPRKLPRYDSNYIWPKKMGVNEELPPTHAEKQYKAGERVMYYNRPATIVKADSGKTPGAAISRDGYYWVKLDSDGKTYYTGCKGLKPAIGEGYGGWDEPEPRERSSDEDRWNAFDKYDPENRLTMKNQRKQNGAIKTATEYWDPKTDTIRSRETGEVLRPMYVDEDSSTGNKDAALKIVSMLPDNTSNFTPEITSQYVQRYLAAVGKTEADLNDIAARVWEHLQYADSGDEWYDTDLDEDAYGPDEHLADLTKISDQKLRQLHALHRHYGQTNPRNAESAERAAREMARRGQKDLLALHGIDDVTEARPAKSVIQQVQDITTNGYGSVKFKDGSMKVDAFTASAVTQVYAALRDDLKAKAEETASTKAGFMKLASFAFKHVGSPVNESIATISGATSPLVKHYAKQRAMQQQAPKKESDIDLSFRALYSSFKDWLTCKGAETDAEVVEGAKVDRMVKHIKKSEKDLGKNDKDAESIAWATANKRGMLDEWDTDTSEEQAQRAEATESGIEFLLKKAGVRLPIPTEQQDQIAQMISDMSNDTGYGATISPDDVLDYFDARNTLDEDIPTIPKISTMNSATKSPSKPNVPNATNSPTTQAADEKQSAVDIMRNLAGIKSQIGPNAASAATPKTAKALDKLSNGEPLDPSMSQAMEPYADMIGKALTDPNTTSQLKRVAGQTKNMTLPGQKPEDGQHDDMQIQENNGWTKERR